MRGSKITKSGKNSYCFRVDYPSEINGERNQKKITVKGNYKDAEKRQREILNEIDKMQFSWTPSKMTLSEFFKEYLEIIKGRNINTYITYVQSFKIFENYLGSNLKLVDVKGILIQKVINELGDKLDNSTIKLYFQKLNVAMKYACKPNVRYLVDNPCVDIIINKALTKEKKVWDDDQSNQFIRFCKDSTFRYTIMFLLLLKTGLRIGELLALRWTDVDLTKNVIHVTRTALRDGSFGPPKSRRSIRKVQIDQNTAKVLLKHKVQQNEEKLKFGEGYNPENLIFCTCNGKLVLKSIVTRSFKRYCKQTQLPNITVHGLRHTHATMLLRNGHSVNAVAERLGDTAETIMMTYGHVTPGMQLEILKTIDDVYE